MDSIKRLYGVYRGVVQDNRDPQNQRRLKIQVQTTGTEVTDWAWPMEPSSIHTDVPVIGQGVWVTYVGGDPEYPVWSGVFGKNKGKNKQVFVKPLADSVSLTSVQDVIVLNNNTDGTKEFDLTESLLAIATKEKSLQTTLNNLQGTVANIVGGTGVQGAQGTRGSQGVQGLIGTQGTTGAGTQGTAGSAGTQGAQGSIGTQGTTGAGTQGTAGSQGATGTQGLIGSQGTTGAGSQGTQGADGVQGSVGIQGATGPAGAQGATGSQGIDGSTGAQGTSGSNGAQGTQGFEGTQGATGATGSQGTVGSQGTIGTGTQGVQGSIGTGTQGTQGTLGTQGTSGATASAPLTLTQSSNNASYPLTISSANQQAGGAGYSDILKLINSKSGATNINKHIRLSDAGTFEIINSAYTASIFALDNGGAVTNVASVNGATIGDTGWTTVSSFTNGFSAVATVAYRRINNVVYLRGNLTGGTANTGAFVLPSGYRPVANAVFPVQQYGTSSINYVTIGSDGVVLMNATSGWLTSIIFPVG